MSESERHKNFHPLNIHVCEECGREFVGTLDECPYCGGKPESKPLSYYKMLARTKKPSASWYLLPFIFGVIGGLIGYVGVKNEDKAMADNVLTLGTIVTVIMVVLLYLLFIL